jgi:hypothetical protein
MRTRLLFGLLLVAICPSVSFCQGTEIPTDTKVINAKDNYDDFETTSFLQGGLYSKLDDYCIKIGYKNEKLFGKTFFQKRFKEIFSTVVVGNSNVVNNGSAFAYTKDKDNNTFSINGTFVYYRWLYDIGASVKNQTTNYNFYSDKSWTSDVTLSLGLSRRIHGSLFVAKSTKSSTPCEDLKFKRQAYADTLITKYQKLVNFTYNIGDLQPTDIVYLDNTKVIDKLKTKLAAVKNKLGEYTKNQRKLLLLKKPENKKSEENKTTITNSIGKKKILKSDKGEIVSISSEETKITDLKDGQKTEKILSTENYDNEGANILVTTNSKSSISEPLEKKTIDYQKEINDLLAIKATLTELIDLRDNSYDDNEVANYLENKLGAFDEKNDYSTGYSIGWLGLKTFITNSSIALKNEDIIDETIQKKYKNLFKLSVELSYNYSHSAFTTLFLKTYGKINRNSFLDVNNLIDSGFNVTPVITNPDNVTDYYSITDDNGQVVNLYTELKHPVYNMDMGGYIGWLPLFKKSLGFNLSTNFNFPIKGVEVNYKPTYSVMAGLLLRVTSEPKWSIATFTINGGFENSYHDVNAWSNFVLRASVGVPFTIFEKAKK